MTESNWFREYTSICGNGVQAILRKEMTPPQLAAFILQNFGSVLSPSAVARLEGIAGEAK